MLNGLILGQVVYPVQQFDARKRAQRQAAMYAAQRAGASYVVQRPNGQWVWIVERKTSIPKVERKRCLQ